MVSSDLRPALRATARTLTLALVAAHYAAFAQPDSLPSADDALQDIVETVGEIQSLRGVNAPELVAPLTALSSFYEERGDYDLALALIAQATQVIEVNRGLHSLDEAQLKRRSIRIERARGNAEAAWNEEQALLTLVRRHPDDERTIPILREIADGRMAMLARYRSGKEFPPEIVLGCYYRESTYDGTFGSRRSGCRSGSRGTVIRAVRGEAYAYRMEAASIAARRERWLGSPCARPQVPDIADESLSRRHAESVETYLRAMSDYVGCMQVKSEHAESTNASPEEKSQLDWDRSDAVAELKERRVVYEKRLGPIKQRFVPRY